MRLDRGDKGVFFRVLRGRVFGCIERVFLRLEGFFLGCCSLFFRVVSSGEVVLFFRVGRGFIMDEMNFVGRETLFGEKVEVGVGLWDG